MYDIYDIIFPSFIHLECFVSLRGDLRWRVCFIAQAGQESNSELTWFLYKYN